MTSTAGFTLIELIVVMVLVAAMVVVVVRFAPNTTAVDARLLASAIASSRLRAAAGGATSELGCVGATPWPRSLDLTAQTTWPPRGLVFTPEGLPRSCDGGGVGNTTILLEHRGRRAAVIVSSLGRVRWELR